MAGIHRKIQIFTIFLTGLYHIQMETDIICFWSSPIIKQISWNIRYGP